MKKLVDSLPKIKRNSAYVIIAICIVTITTYVLNYFYPLLVDDWHYSFIYGEDPFRRVTNIGDIVTSQYNFYHQWGGRTVAHSIAQILLLINPIWQDILNTLMYVLFVFLIYKIANFDNTANANILIIVSVLLCLFQPGFVAATIWLTGSANYLWQMVIILLFMYRYYTYYRTGKTKNNIFTSILYLPFGILAGWTNENMAIALIFFIIAIMYLYKKQKQDIPMWTIFGLAGVIIGATFMIAAPGNHVRYVKEMLARQDDVDVNSSIISIKSIIIGVPKMLFNYLKRLLWLSVPYLLLLYYFKKKTTNTQTQKMIINISLLFFVTAHIAFFAMIASPIFPSRAYFGIITLIIIAIAILYSNFEFSGVLHKVNTVILTLAIIALIIDFSVKFKNILLIHDTLAKREKIIEEGKKNGIKDFVFTDAIKVNDRYMFREFSDDSNDWFNYLYSQYYGINSVKVIKKE